MSGEKIGYNVKGSMWYTTSHLFCYYVFASGRKTAFIRREMKKIIQCMTKRCDKKVRQRSKTEYDENVVHFGGCLT